MPMGFGLQEKSSRGFTRHKSFKCHLYGVGFCLCEEEVVEFCRAVAEAEQLIDRNDAVNIEGVLDFLSNEFGTTVYKSNGYEDIANFDKWVRPELNMILPFWAEHQPDIYRAAYPNRKAIIDEFRALLGEYLPENFNYDGHIGYFEIDVCESRAV